MIFEVNQTHVAYESLAMTKLAVENSVYTSNRSFMLELRERSPSPASRLSQPVCLCQLSWL